MGTWTAPLAGVTIEYPLELIDEIRLTVSSTFHTALHDGVPAGGVFYGRRAEGVTRIEAWRPIEREQGRSTVYSLSDQEVANLKNLAQNSPQEASLQHLEAVGWFVPHTDGSLALAKADRRIFDACFPGGGRFTLVLAAAGPGLTKAAFFARDAHGQIDEQAAGREFAVAPLYAPRKGRRGQRREPEAVPPAAVATAVEQPMKRQNWRVWLGAMTVLLVAAVPAFLAGQRSAPERDREALALRLQDRAGANSTSRGTSTLSNRGGAVSSRSSTTPAAAL